MLRPNILLDMDGVLCNFIGKFAETIGENYDDLIRRWPLGEYSVSKVLGITDNLMWAVIGMYGAKWWEDIEEFSWSRYLWRECKIIGNTFILTQPSQHPASLSGKLAWIKNFTGDDNFRNYMMSPQKQLCVGTNNFLIDDNEANVSKFGKNGILFPMIHNRLYHLRANPVDYVLKTLKKRIKRPLASCGF